MTTRRKEKEVRKKRFATVLAVALVPAAMLASAAAASSAPGAGGADGGKAGKGATSGFATEGSKRFGAGESS